MIALPHQLSETLKRFTTESSQNFKVQKMKHPYKQNDMNKLPYRKILNRCIMTCDKKLHYPLERSFSGSASLPRDGFKGRNPYPNQELIPICPVHSQFLY